MILKGGLYVDEIKNLLIKYTDKKTVTNFYTKHVFFEIENGPKYIQFENVNPLLKVAWNIITRGDYTRASLIVTNFILSKYFQKQSKPINYINSTLVTTIDFDNEKEKDNENLRNILLNFSTLTQEELINLYKRKIEKSTFAKRNVPISAQK